MFWKRKTFFGSFTPIKHHTNLSNKADFDKTFIYQNFKNRPVIQKSKISSRVLTKWHIFFSPCQHSNYVKSIMSMFPLIEWQNDICFYVIEIKFPIQISELWKLPGKNFLNVSSIKNETFETDDKIKSLVQNWFLSVLVPDWAEWYSQFSNSQSLVSKTSSFVVVNSIFSSFSRYFWQPTQENTSFFVCRKCHSIRILNNCCVAERGIQIRTLQFFYYYFTKFK